MDISVDSIDENGDELDLEVAVGGYHEVELNETETVSLSIDDILRKIDDDKLLDHVGEAGIKAYAESHDIKLEADAKEVNADTIIAWLRTSDDEQLYAVAAAVTATLAKRGELILEAHKK